MKSFLFILTLIAMFSFSSAQNKVYDSHANVKNFTREKIDIIFTGSSNGVRFPDNPAKEAGIVESVLPTAVDLVFKTATKLLENHVKKFTAEYTKQQSNMLAGNQMAPDFQFRRTLGFEHRSDTTALEINFIAHKIEREKLFFYALKNIHLNYSSARSNAKSKKFDYTIELKLTYLVKGEKKLMEVAPIIVSSVHYGDTAFADPVENRTDLIPMPDGALLTEVSVKITETNPLKVRAEKILAAWNDHKDEVRTVVNNIFPEVKSGGSSGGSSSGAEDAKKKQPSTDPNKTSGNDEKKEAPKKH